MTPIEHAAAILYQRCGRMELAKRIVHHIQAAVQEERRYCLAIMRAYMPRRCGSGEAAYWRKCMAAIDAPRCNGAPVDEA